MIHERPTQNQIRRRARQLMLVTLPLFSGAAGGVIGALAMPEDLTPMFACATATALFALLLILQRLKSPKKRRWLGVVGLAAFFGIMNVPLAVLLGGPGALHIQGIGPLLGYALWGGIVASPLSGAFGACFGLCWLAALKRFAQAMAQPTLADIPSLTSRVGAGALGLAALSGLTLLASSHFVTNFVTRPGLDGAASWHAEPIVAGSMMLMVLGGLMLLADGLWARRRLMHLIRDAEAGTHPNFRLASADVGEAPASGLVEVTRNAPCTRVLCRRTDAQGEGAYRLNREHLTPWALMP